MSQSVLFVRRSKNIKTGPIPVTVASRTTCPETCALKGKCFGEDFFTMLQWNRVDRGDGVTWSTLCASIAALPEGQIWRAHVTGDLPEKGGRVDRRKVRQLARANSGRMGFTYSHHRSAHALDVIREANAAGFTINLSADNLTQADELADTGAGPVVTLLPGDAPSMQKTPAGRRVIVCPAQQRDDVTCATCKLCARGNRSTIIGFLAHGSRAKVADGLARQTISIRAI